MEFEEMIAEAVRVLYEELKAKGKGMDKLAEVLSEVVGEGVGENRVWLKTARREKMEEMGWIRKEYLAKASRKRKQSQKKVAQKAIPALPVPRKGQSQSAKSFKSSLNS
ncbi:hypothetical protein GBAR_LOCUS9799 [Geodia barretti]|uniref:Uncharacterized protein n=1 Tax=Geodia barretti TaxID=519541 RepID=A0AA35WCV3_GEOBA|nr:hypothetical protein GBAR_LOCUS9799 [Geodia barretti]